MRKNFKKIIILFITIIFFFSNQRVDASSLLLKPSSNIVGIGEQFYVDISIDTEGKIINGIEGSISFSSSNLKFIRAEEGKSLISFWVEKPKLTDSQISFAGIIPNGFSGIIDPFNTNTIFRMRM